MDRAQPNLETKYGNVTRMDAYISSSMTPNELIVFYALIRLIDRLVTKRSYVLCRTNLHARHFSGYNRQNRQ